jgi:hypothetical protein
MTDKPLDCIGIDLRSSPIGKHDFRLRDSPTASTLPEAETIHPGAFDAAIAMLKDHKFQAKRLAASGKTTQAFFDKLKSSVTTLPEDRPSPVFSLFGFRIHVADDLPPGVLAEFRNADGELVGRMTE